MHLPLNMVLTRSFRPPSPIALPQQIRHISTGAIRGPSNIRSPVSFSSSLHRSGGQRPTTLTYHVSPQGIRMASIIDTDREKVLKEMGDRLDEIIDWGGVELIRGMLKQAGPSSYFPEAIKNKVEREILQLREDSGIDFDYQMQAHTREESARLRDHLYSLQQYCLKLIALGVAYDIGRDTPYIIKSMYDSYLQEPNKLDKEAKAQLTKILTDFCLKTNSNRKDVPREILEEHCARKVAPVVAHIWGGEPWTEPCACRDRGCVKEPGDCSEGCQSEGGCSMKFGEGAFNSALSSEYVMEALKKAGPDGDVPADVRFQIEQDFNRLRALVDFHYRMTEVSPEELNRFHQHLQSCGNYVHGLMVIARKYGITTGSPTYIVFMYDDYLLEGQKLLPAAEAALKQALEENCEKKMKWPLNAAKRELMKHTCGKVVPNRILNHLSGRESYTPETLCPHRQCKLPIMQVAKSASQESTTAFDSSSSHEQQEEVKEVPLYTLKGSARDHYIKRIIARSRNDSSIPVPDDVEKAVVDEIMQIRRKESRLKPDFKMLDYSHEQQEKHIDRGELLKEYVKLLMKLSQKYGFEGRPPSMMILNALQPCVAVIDKVHETLSDELSRVMTEYKKTRQERKKAKT